MKIPSSTIPSASRRPTEHFDSDRTIRFNARTETRGLADIVGWHFECKPSAAKGIAIIYSRDSRVRNVATEVRSEMKAMSHLF